MNKVSKTLTTIIHKLIILKNLKEILLTDQEMFKNSPAAEVG